MSSLCTNTIQLGVTDSEWKEIKQSLKDGIIRWPFGMSESDFFEESKSIFFNSKNYPGAWKEGYMADLSKAYPSVVFDYSANLEFEGKMGAWFCDGEETYESKAQTIKKDVYKKEYERFMSATSQCASGIMHRVEVLPNGCVFAEGENRYGECNVSTWSDIKKISCGNWHTVGLKHDGTILTCGSNYNGQCDIPDIDDTIIDISCGRYHTAYLLESGRVLIMGEVQDEASDPSPEDATRYAYWQGPRYEPVIKEKFPFIAELKIDKHMNGWEHMNEVIEEISVGEELILKPSKECGYEAFVFDKDKNPIGKIMYFGIGNIITDMNHIKATVKDVTPLSKRRKGTKYAQMNVELEYIEKRDDFYDRMIQVGPTSHWPKATKIKSVFDAVAGVTESGEILVEGFCPCSNEEIKKYFKTSEE